MIRIVVAPRRTARLPPQVRLEVGRHPLRHVGAVRLGGNRHRRALPLDGLGEQPQLGQGHGHRLRDGRGRLGLHQHAHQLQRPPAVAHPLIRRRGQQPGQGVRELRPAGVYRNRPREALASGRVPPETHERHRLTEPRRGIPRIELDHAAVGSQGRLEPRRPPQRVRQRQMRRPKNRVVEHGVGEPVHRLGITTAPREQSAQRVVCPVRARVESQRLLERGLRPSRVTRPLQHGSQVQPQHGQLRRSVRCSPEVRRRERPVAAGGGMRREVAVVLRIPENPVQGGQQRIRECHRATGTTRPPAPELALCPLPVAQPPVGHGQRIVDAAGLGIERQRRLQVFDGGSRVLQLQRDATRLEPQRRRVGPPLEHLADE